MKKLLLFLLHFINAYDYYQESLKINKDYFIIKWCQLVTSRLNTVNEILHFYPKTEFL